MERMVFISHSTADKAIADAICHRLEEAGVRCWIAPRDITNSDWAGSIMDGLRRCAYLKHDFDAARDYLDKAMGVFQRLYDAAADDAGRENARWHSGDTVVEIERLYMEQGDYETALRYCQESYDIFYAHNNCEVTNSEYSLVDMGICCSALGRYEEAEEYLQRALDLNIRLNGEASVQTVRTREAIADNFRRKGDLEKAHSLYVQLELELERDFGADNPQVRQIREKRESFSRGSEVRA